MFLILDCRKEQAMSKKFKLGGVYAVRVKVTCIADCGDVYCRTVDENGHIINSDYDPFVFAPDEYVAVNQIGEEKQTDSACSKYDPCRKFRKGDIVRFKKVNGNNARCRYNGTEIKEGSLGRISKKEGRNTQGA